MLGAFGTHALRDQLSAQDMQTFSTATRYQIYHAFALIAVGLVRLHSASRSLAIAGALFIAGVIIFSGSLYLLTLTGTRWLGAVTPIGGLFLISGWILLTIAVLRDR
ncbi:MAG: DUF423 domain-containing protein [Gammaproteobacteria bacterium]|nr:DUF423 domain-containing protein [Gammaproteobacteria bacterium]